MNMVPIDELSEEAIAAARARRSRERCAQGRPARASSVLSAQNCM